MMVYATFICPVIPIIPFVVSGCETMDYLDTKIGEIVDNHTDGIESGLPKSSGEQTDELKRYRNLE